MSLFKISLKVFKDQIISLCVFLKNEVIFFYSTVTGMKTDLPATVEFYISVAEECVCVSIANLKRKRERKKEGM